LEEVWQNALRNINITASEIGALNRVNVAMIDDGVDILEIPQARVERGISFEARDGDNDRVKPYYTSASGHGTAMAKLLLRLFPHVNLSIARISPGKHFAESVLDVSPRAQSLHKHTTNICTRRR
jgi:hypothetical protein